MMCRHCHRRKANRPRGLCWAHYYAPAVRALYPAKVTPPHDTPLRGERHAVVAERIERYRGIVAAGGRLFEKTP